MTIKSLLCAFPLLGLGWISVLLAVAVFSDAAPAYVVVFPKEGFVEELPNEVALIGSSSMSITLKSTTPQFAMSLYQNGAWLVLPAGLPGCLPLPKSVASP